MSDTRVMPKYQSIKQVWGLKIKDIVPKPTEVNQESDGSMWMIPEEEGYDKISLSHEFFKKHNPHVGGYYVVYKDGYKSFSPATPFEEGNIPLFNSSYNTELSFKDVSKEYQKRVCIEYDELHGKMMSLKKYLKDNSDELLDLQLKYMSGYAGVLGKRIEGFK
jgi:hypothetical protein